MRNWMKRASALVLCLLLSLCLPLTALAEEVDDSGTVLRIFRKQQFLDLAENCRLDSYSQNLTVVLMSDIDLSGEDFGGIPIFCGTFDGNGHAVSGLNITADGSTMGLFRYISKTGVVQDLKVIGSVTPGGSGSSAGGVAGNNAGTIRKCSFSGTVSGVDDVGGIVGVNTVDGIVENCHTGGTVTGSHRIGGIAGHNQGVIRSCVNRAQVNTTAEENEVNLSDITLDTITGTESANTVTDIGGIAGASSGVLRECKNRGNVGYQHMGYNVGGIAGTQTGYVYKCSNFARIYGRKEVGGIVGQMEPTTYLEYTKDTLQILQGQLSSLSGLTSQAVSTAQNSASDLIGQVNQLSGTIQDARNAVDSLIPDPDNPSLPDLDSVEAAKNSLSSSLSSINTSLYGMADSTKDSMDSLTRTLRAITGQVGAMSATIGSADENMGGAITDISDQDSDDVLSGKVESCSNAGEVLADLNAGGITGAIALENDLDPESDLQITGNNSMNFNTKLRGVIRSCKNTGTVTVKRQNAGGIVGWMSLGLTRDCLSTGSVSAENANYVGGVAGQSSGYLRSCSAKAAIDGGAYVGGIAGKAVTVTDCRSMVKLTGTEKTGAVLGLREEPAGSSEEETESKEEEQTESVTGNYYLPVEQDIGGIDGVSYSGCAQGLDETAFSRLDGLDPVFRTVSLRFVYEDGSVRTVSLSTGQALSPDQIPELPEKKGYTCYWDGLADTDLSAIGFDTTFQAVSLAEKKTVQSNDTRKNGLPVLLAEGQFSGEEPIALTPMAKGPAPGVNDTFLEGFAFTLPDGDCDTLRYLPENPWEAKTDRVYVRGTDGAWREAEASADASYLVFSVQAGDQAFCIVRTTPKFPTAVAAAAGAGAVAVIVVTALLIRRRRKQKSAPTEAEKENTP
ncbi:MAG: hypothetical protein PUD80_08760 [Firmicutes bacterium]|nr:hypothetical protein [Bacillota bacterium]